ncbi:MAG: ChbG/HpnK family deacetylase [Alphaproteobacteria bacterium]|nr:ChbG/HpnK family deacetylase [Alphaproteobacteria bacterium]
MIKICADDFGLTPGISQAIVKLCTEGNIHATSVMTEGAYAEEYAPALLRAGAEIGLHFNLTEPFGDVPAYKLSHLMLSPFPPAVVRRDVARRLRAQHDAFTNIFQRRPDFIDGHQHVHMFPGLRGVFLSTLSEIYAGSSVRPWIRRVNPALFDTTDDRFKLLVLRILNTGFRRACEKAGFATNDSFTGIYSFSPRSPYRDYLDKWVKTSAPRTLMMCHPSAAKEAGDPISAARVLEYAALSALPPSKEKTS